MHRAIRKVWQLTDAEKTEYAKANNGISADFLQIGNYVDNAQFVEEFELPRHQCDGRLEAQYDNKAWILDNLKILYYKNINHSKAENKDVIVDMPYAEYKKEWPNCKTVKNSYDPVTNTVSVIIPETWAELKRVIPREEIESFRQGLIDTGAPEYACTGKMLDRFCEELRGAKLTDFNKLDSRGLDIRYQGTLDAAWVAKALKIVNG